MKFLIALTILASSSVFAEDMSKKIIKCFDTPQDSQSRDVVYKFLVKRHKIKLIKPDITEGFLEQVPHGDFACLEGRKNQQVTFEACPGEGQEIRGLVPVEVDGEGTVYCERAILRWFEIPEVAL